MSSIVGTQCLSKAEVLVAHKNQNFENGLLFHKDIQENITSQI